jgi:hypothetical protein
MKNRFEAEWIAAQYHDEHGEWQPDHDDYRAENCPDLETAKRVAVERGKAANVVEWARVTEYAFDPDLGIPARCEAAWDIVRQWSGDWQGSWDEVR